MVEIQGLHRWCSWMTVFVDDDIVEHFIKFEVAKLNWALSLSQ